MTSQMPMHYDYPENETVDYKLWQLGSCSALSRLFHCHTPMIESTLVNTGGSIGLRTHQSHIDKIVIPPPTANQTRFLSGLRLTLDLPALHAFPTAAVPADGIGKCGFAVYHNDVLARSLKSLKVTISQSGEHTFIVIDKSQESGVVQLWVHFKHCDEEPEKLFYQGVFSSFDDCLKFSCHDRHVYVDIDVPFIRTDANMVIEAATTWAPMTELFSSVHGIIGAATTHPRDGPGGLGDYPVIQTQAAYSGELPFVISTKDSDFGTANHFRQISDGDISYRWTARFLNMVARNTKNFPAKFNNQSTVKDYHIQTLTIPLASTTVGRTQLQIIGSATVKYIRAFATHSLTGVPNYGLSFLASGFGLEMGTKTGHPSNSAGPNNAFNKTYCSMPVLSCVPGGQLMTDILDPTHASATNIATYATTYSQMTGASRFPALTKLAVGSTANAIAGDEVTHIPGLMHYSLCNESQSLGVELRSDIELTAFVDERMRMELTKDKLVVVNPTSGVISSIASGMQDNPRTRQTNHVTVVLAYATERRIVQKNDNSLWLAIL